MSDDLLRDIDDDLRREALERWWRRRGALVMTGAAAILLVVAGVQVVTGLTRADQEQRTEALLTALQSEPGGEAATLQRLAQLAQQGRDGPATLARIGAAGVLATQGDAGAAAGHLELATTAEDPLLAEMARTLAGYARLTPASLSGPAPSALSPAAAQALPASGPYAPFAREIAALALLRDGRRAEAASAFRALAAADDTPDAMRVRATDLARALSESP